MLGLVKAGVNIPALVRIASCQPALILVKPDTRHNVILLPDCATMHNGLG